MFLHDFGTKSRFSFGILFLQTTWFTMYLHDLGTKSRFSFRILIAKNETTVYLKNLLIHDANLILEISLFGSWSSKMRQMSTESSNSRCEFSLGNLTFRILILQTSWLTVHLHVFAWFWDQTQVQFWDPDPPSQLAYSSFACICMILGPSPGSVLRSWSSKPAGLQFICMVLGPNPHWFCQKVNI